MDTKKMSASIKQLSLIEPNRSPVISCFLNLDQSRFQPLDEIESWAQIAAATLRGQAKEDFQDALEEIRDWISTKRKDDAKGVALFCRWGDEPFFTALQFHKALTTSFHVDSVPLVYPLVELKDIYHRFIIVLTTEERAQIIETNIGAVTETIITERPELRERVGREWTKEHYQNHRRDRNDRFHKEKVRIIDQLVTEGKHSHIILAGSPNLVSKMHHALPKRLQEKVVNTLTATPQDGVSAVVKHALQVFVEYEQEISIANVQRLEEAILRGDGLGAVGYTEVKQALEYGQADLLLLDQDLDDPEMQEELTKLAIRSNVEVETVSGSSLLASYGGVGCLLRYHLPSSPSESQKAA